MHVLFFLGYGHMDDRKPKRESTGGCALVQLLQVSVFQFQFQHDFHLRMLSSNFVQEFSSGRDADWIGVIQPTFNSLDREDVAVLSGAAELVTVKLNLKAVTSCLHVCTARIPSTQCFLNCSSFL